jgi:hypothetical protein
MKIATCQHCGQPFEYEPVEFGGRELIQPVACDSCVAKHDAEKAADRERDRLGKRREEWLTICPPLYRDTDPKHPRLSPAIRVALAGWKPNGKGIGLALCGASGKGKTRLAFWRLHQLHMDGLTVFAVSSKRLEKAIHDSFSDDTRRRAEAEGVIESARKAEVLLLDDVGKEKFTERVASEFYELIEHRTSFLLPTIWTANTSKAELAARLGAEHGDATMRRLAEFSEFITV